MNSARRGGCQRIVRGLLPRAAQDWSYPSTRSDRLSVREWAGGAPVCMPARHDGLDLWFWRRCGVFVADVWPASESLIPWHVRRPSPARYRLAIGPTCGSGTNHNRSSSDSTSADYGTRTGASRGLVVGPSGDRTQDRRIKSLLASFRVRQSTLNLREVPNPCTPARNPVLMPPAGHLTTGLDHQGGQQSRVRRRRQSSDLRSARAQNGTSPRRNLHIDKSS